MKKRNTGSLLQIHDSFEQCSWISARLGKVQGAVSQYFRRHCRLGHACACWAMSRWAARARPRDGPRAPPSGPLGPLPCVSPWLGRCPRPARCPASVAGHTLCPAWAGLVVDAPGRAVRLRAGLVTLAWAGPGSRAERGVAGLFEL